jgi:hypothetical protein
MKKRSIVTIGSGALAMGAPMAGTGFSETEKDTLSAPSETLPNLERRSRNLPEPA